MLIIFDLDDTLVDTSGSITPSVLRKGLKEMEEAGFEMDDFERYYAALSRLNSYHLTTRDAFEEFAEIHNAPLPALEAALEVASAPPFDDPVYPIEDAPWILDELSLLHPLVLVTRGSEVVQREKMERAGISDSLFTKLYFCSEEEKQPIYQRVSEEMGISPLNGLVCGDRISLDLTPAKLLGYKTVQFRWGRGLGETGYKGDVDYTILELKELRSLLQTMKTTG